MQFSREHFAANLRALRAYKGVSQDEVAAALGMPTNTLGNYETGKSAPSYETSWRIADYYGVPLDVLGGRTGYGPDDAPAVVLAHQGK